MKVSKVARFEIQLLQHTIDKDQCLMKLMLEYEIVRSNLMSKVSYRSLNIRLNELLHEEQNQITQHALKQQSSRNATGVCYLATEERQYVTSQGSSRDQTTYVAKGTS